jgi:hypothetical protein
VNKKSISFAAAAAVTLAPLALAAPSQGAVVAPAKTLYACQKKSNGALRIVKKSKKCKKSEKKISWNTQGPKGDKGDIGTPGAPGPGATPINASLTTTNMLGNTQSQEFAMGDSTLTIQCVSFLGGVGSSARITSPSAGTYQTRGSWLNNPNNAEGDYNVAPFRDSKDGSFNANTVTTMAQQTLQVIVTAGDANRNIGVMNYTITNGSGTYFVTYVATTVGQENPPTASPKGSCDVTGWWSKLS